MPRGSRPGERRGGRKPGVPNRATGEIKAVAQAYGPEAIRTLADLMRTASSETARIMATTALLDRAYGKPRQEIEHSGTIGRRAEDLSDADLLAIASGRSARAAAPESGATEPDQLH